MSSNTNQPNDTATNLYVNVNRVDLYSAESWSISTVLSGSDEIGSFSLIVWSCC